MAGRRRVVWTEPSVDLLSETVGYLAERSIVVAARFLRDVEEASNSLELLPERGRLVPELAGTGIREVFVHRFRLMYLVLSEEVVVLAFVHGRRDFR